MSRSQLHTLQTMPFIIHFFCSKFNFIINKFFLSMNAILLIAIPARTSLVTYPSTEIQLPKYLKWAYLFNSLIVQ